MQKNEESLDFDVFLAYTCRVFLKTIFVMVFLFYVLNRIIDA